MKITQSNYLEQVSKHNLLNLHPAIEDGHNFLAKATKGFTTWDFINKTPERQELWDSHVKLILKYKPEDNNDLEIIYPELTPVSVKHQGNFVQGELAHDVFQYHKKNDEKVPVRIFPNGPRLSKRLYINFSDINFKPEEERLEIKSNPAVKQETKEKAERAVKAVKTKMASDPCEECAEKKAGKKTPVRSKSSKPKAEGRKPKASKPKAEPKPKAPTKSELKEQAKLGHYQKSKKVAHSPEEFTHIKTFIRLVSQSSKEKLIRALKALQKAITSEKIKGSSKWADIILKIQDAYLDVLNAGKAPYDLKSSKEFLTKLADEINDYSIFKSVEMLNRFVGATEKELSDSAYKSLRNAFIKAEKYVKDSDPYASRFNEVLSALKKSETAKNFSFDSASLNGIQGLTIFRYAKPKKTKSKPKAKAVKK